MQTEFQDDRTNPVNVAATFDKSGIEHYDREKIREYVENRLDANDFLYTSVVALDMDTGTYTIQCKLNKTSVSMDALYELDGIFDSMDGYIDMWVLSESALYHPEIYE